MDSLTGLNLIHVQIIEMNWIELNWIHVQTNTNVTEFIALLLCVTMWNRERAGH